MVFLLLRNLPMGFSTVNASITSCTGEEVRTQGAFPLCILELLRTVSFNKSFNYHLKISSS